MFRTWRSLRRRSNLLHRCLRRTSNIFTGEAGFIYLALDKNMCTRAINSAPWQRLLHLCKFNIHKLNKSERPVLREKTYSSLKCSPTSCKPRSFPGFEVNQDASVQMVTNHSALHFYRPTDGDYCEFHCN